LNGVDFNTQSENELGALQNDLECNMKYINDVSIEIKNQNLGLDAVFAKNDDVNKDGRKPKNRIPQSKNI
jgi:hypothetical protein